MRDSRPSLVHSQNKVGRVVSENHTDSSRRSFLRQGLLLGGVASASAIAGGALAYKHRGRLSETWQRVKGAPEVPTKQAQFYREAARIRAAQTRQTRETVKLLKAKYESPVFGKVRVWDMIEKLGMCTDPSDDTLMLTSQYVHGQQFSKAWNGTASTIAI